MEQSSQARSERSAPEKVISVDLNQADENKAVTRRTEFSDQVREDGRGKGPQKKSPAERELYKRMSRMERNLQRTFDQKLADRDAEHQRETSALRAELDALKLEQDDPTPDASEHERTMKGLEDELAAANEKGDSAAAARITAKMIRTDGAYHAKLSGTKQRADATGQDKGKTGDKSAGATTQRQGQGQKPTAAGARFITANDGWWDDPEFQIEKDAASSIYVRLVQQEGYDPNDDETFAEVAAQLASKFPDLGVRTHGKRARSQDVDEEGEGEEGEGEAREGEGRAPRRAAAGDFRDRGESGERQRSTRRVLTNQEKKTMRDVGMDPDNDKHVVRFLREAIAMEA